MGTFPLAVGDGVIPFGSDCVLADPESSLLEKRAVSGECGKTPPLRPWAGMLRVMEPLTPDNKPAELGTSERHLSYIQKGIHK